MQSTISGNLLVLVLLWQEAKGHPCKAIHTNPPIVYMLLGAKWPTYTNHQNQIMQQMSTMELSSLRLVEALDMVRPSNSMDMTTESMAAMVRSFSIISHNHSTPVSWICWVLWSPQFRTRLQGIHLESSRLHS